MKLTYEIILIFFKFKNKDRFGKSIREESFPIRIDWF